MDRVFIWQLVQQLFPWQHVHTRIFGNTVSMATLLLWMHELLYPRLSFPESCTEMCTLILLSALLWDPMSIIFLTPPVCPVGLSSVVSTSGSRGCSPCPAHSTTNSSSLFCECVQGYYRNQMEDGSVPCSCKLVSMCLPFPSFPIPPLPPPLPSRLIPSPPL